MPRSLRWIPLLALPVSVAGCDPATLFGHCSDDLVTRVDPRSWSVGVGESYVAVASAWGCGGTRRLSDEWRYFAADTSVARVDSATGRVTARARGTTAIHAHGRKYGNVVNPSRLTVVP